MKLVIGNKNYSSWSMRAWLMLSAYDLEFDEVRIPLNRPETPALMARHTAADKVPVLHDGDLRVWDSLAICEYVSEQYLQGRGWPVDTAARAVARSVSAEMHSGFSALRGQLPMNCRASNRGVPSSPSLLTDIRRITQIWTQLREHYANQGPWLFGEFSIADCVYAPVVSRFDVYGVAMPPICTAYMTQVLNHKKMRLWYDQARNETEIIGEEEVGQ